jgi:cation diffusion facilitator family transporter
MTAVSAPQSPYDANIRAVRRVLWLVLILNALVALAKLVTGLLTGTVSMIADGFHSSVDASSNVVGLVAIRLAALPPDEDHPYGHRRFETLATLAIGGLMLVAAWEILQTAIDRVLHGGSPNPTPVAFAVMLGTMTLNLGVTLYERRRGQVLSSDILLADAAHTASDVFVSLSVLVSLVVTSLGYPWIDVIVALLIVSIIARVGLGIIGRTSNTLADHQVLDPADVTDSIRSIPGIEEIVRIRSRGSGDAIYVDIDTRIKPAITTDHAYAIAKTIKTTVRERFPGVAEVQVHFAPQKRAGMDYALEARAVADALGLNIHEVIPVPVEDGIALEMHVEVKPGLTLGEAHRQVSRLERNLKSQIPRVSEVLTHIEPANERGAPLMHTQAALDLRDQAVNIARSLYEDANWHHANIRLALGGYALTMHCHLPASVSVEEAHSIAEHVETCIRNELPLITRVTIHTEPPPDANSDRALPAQTRPSEEVTE